MSTHIECMCVCPWGTRCRHTRTEGRASGSQVQLGTIHKGGCPHNETTYPDPYTWPLTGNPPEPDFRITWGRVRGMLFHYF